MSDQTMKEKFERAVSELIGMCEDAGLDLNEFAEILEAEAKRCRDRTLPFPGQPDVMDVRDGVVCATQTVR